MFRSYEPGREAFVTFIANYLPLQDPYGGPNFFDLDPEALYEIHVDNDGDAREDLTFQFRFQTRLRDIALDIGTGKQKKRVAIPLINAGSISASNNDALNRLESYTLTLVRGDRRKGRAAAITNAHDGATTFAKPVDNIGKKSIPDYDSYARAHVFEIRIPGCASAGSTANKGAELTGRVFVGQRK